MIIYLIEEYITETYNNNGQNLKRKIILGLKYIDHNFTQNRHGTDNRNSWFWPLQLKVMYLLQALRYVSLPFKRLLDSFSSLCRSNRWRKGTWWCTNIHFYNKRKKNNLFTANFSGSYFENTIISRRHITISRALIGRFGDCRFWNSGFNGDCRFWYHKEILIPKNYGKMPDLIQYSRIRL